MQRCRLSDGIPIRAFGPYYEVQKLTTKRKRPQSRLLVSSTTDQRPQKKWKLDGTGKSANSPDRVYLRKLPNRRPNVLLSRSLLVAWTNNRAMTATDRTCRFCLLHSGTSAAGTKGRGCSRKDNLCYPSLLVIINAVIVEDPRSQSQHHLN